MKRETFFEKFDQLADAPNALPKMRELVLDLAFQGKLLSQDPNDEPAAASFPKLASLAIRAGEDGFPSHWLRVPLGKVGEWRGGGTPSKSRSDFWTGEIPWVSPKDMKVFYISNAQDHISQAAVEGSSVRMIPSGSLLMVVRGMILARAFPVALTTRKVTINQDMKALLPTEAETREFLLLALRALEPQVLGGIERSSHGTCKLQTGFLHGLTIAFPPLAEQKRIVAKVDELMALCDQLEAQQQERETRYAALARASLARFAEVPTSANLNFLFHKSYSISPADLRKSILTLAVQGKLVPQDPDDEPAAVVLSRLEGQGGNAKVRRNVPAKVGKNDLVDEETIPETWAIESTARLLRLGAILDIKDGNHGANHPKVAEFTESGLPFITAAQVSADGKIDYSTAYKLSGEALQRLRVGFAKPGDVIYTHKGSVGRVAICSRDCVLTPQTTYYRLNAEVLHGGFVRLFLLSPLFRRQADGVKRQTTRDFVSISSQYKFFLRVPPLAEQRRIVARVDRLMIFVDQLETQLGASQTTASSLLEAVVAELAV